MTRAVGKPHINSDWTASGGGLVFTSTASKDYIDWGSDGNGFIQKWYGETSGAYMSWQPSGDELLFTNTELRTPSASITTAAITNASIASAFLASASIGSVIISSGSITTIAITSVSIRCANIASASFSSSITFADGLNIVLASASGTKIGTASTQKLGFFGATPTTPIKFSVSAIDIASALRDLGLMTTTSA